MKGYIAERVVDIAEYLLKYQCTVREVAKVYCVSKSTAHKDLSEKITANRRRALQRKWLAFYRTTGTTDIFRGGEAANVNIKRKPLDGFLF